MAIYVSGSKNSKLSLTNNVDTTYASIKSTCPKTCELRNTACYAKLGYVGIQVARLDKKNYTALEAARLEAKLINDSYNGGIVPGKILRLHVSGDTRIKKGVALINNACKRWLNRGGKAIWTYTHAWATINRKEWSSVSILASVDKIEDIAKARLMGYAPAIAISEHPSDKKFPVKGTNVEFIPCPAQTKDIKCDQCQLCLKADYLFENNLGIAFAAHGVAKRKIKLNVI